MQPRNRRFCLRFVRHLNEPETFGYAGKLVLGKADGRKLAEWFEKRPKLSLGYITRQIPDKEIHCISLGLSAFE